MGNAKIYKNILLTLLAICVASTYMLKLKLGHDFISNNYRIDEYFFLRNVQWIINIAVFISSCLFVLIDYRQQSKAVLKSVITMIICLFVLICCFPAENTGMEIPLFNASFAEGNDEGTFIVGENNPSDEELQAFVAINLREKAPKTNIEYSLVRLEYHKNEYGDNYYIVYWQ